MPSPDAAPVPSNGSSAPRGGRVAVVGRRASVLEPLARSLEARGIDAVVMPVGSAADLARHRDDLAADRFEVVAFGRAVDDADRRRLMDAARSRNPRAQRVDGAAPITELLVAQIEHGVRRSQAVTDDDPVVVIEAVPEPAVFVRTSSDDVEVVRHQLGVLMRGRSTPMTVERDGSDVVALFGRQPSARRDFVSVRVDGVCVFVGDSLGRLPLCQ